MQLYLLGAQLSQITACCCRSSCTDAEVWVLCSSPATDAQQCSIHNTLSESFSPSVLCLPSDIVLAPPLAANCCRSVAAQGQCCSVEHHPAAVPKACSSCPTRNAPGTSSSSSSCCSTGRRQGQQGSRAAAEPLRDVGSCCIRRRVCCK